MSDERFRSTVEALLAQLPPGLEASRPALEALLGEEERLTRRLEKISRISDGYQARLLALNQELRETNERLSQALAEVKTLRGFIPICSHCKRIRDDQGYWNQLEAYLAEHSEASFSHGICPQCAHDLYPEFFPAEPEAAGGEARAPRPEGPGEDAEDGEVEALRSRLDALRETEGHGDHPLMAELDGLAQRHARLLRRLGKITRISDGFQRQMKELNAALLAASCTDALTGLPNRRDMVERLSTELARAARTGAPTAVLMVDVDHFKAVNDGYGHEVGDLVLQTLALAFTEGLRVYDSCARWGGEEFLILLPESDEAAARAVAEKIRARAEGVGSPRAEPLAAPTVSVGVAVHRRGEPLASLLKRADAAMYEAKRLGRNRVEVASA